MSADNLPRRLLRFMRRNRRRNADWWADEWCREATELDALARRMDAVREWCDEILAQCAEAESRGEVLEMPHRILKAAAQHVLARLDGDGEAGR